MTLRVPHDYDGQARCPACTHVFQVNPVEQPAPEPVPVVEKVEQKRVDDDITEVVNESKSVPIKNKPSPSKPKPTRSSSAEHTSSSVGDEIRCPSCGQRLRVPYDRRPITAKCPRCEVKFMAEKE
jgi:DNA-directed RNA polymerase subunit RPC12/RpoP